MLKKIEQKLKEKKGISTLEFVISFLIFIIIFSFVFDFFLISYKQHQVSRLTTDITREVALQSGIKNRTPSNYPGGEKNYITTTEMYNKIAEQMSFMGVTDYKVTISMTDRNGSNNVAKTFVLTENHEGYNTDYRGEISVTIDYTYRWGMWRNFVPGIPDGERSVTRTGYGDYKHDYGSWKGER